MKKQFSTHWKSSKQPRKQRKYLANAPLHIKRKMLSVNLSKPLREKHKTRNIEVRKGDLVKIMRGKFRKKQGKIIQVKTKELKIYIEGMQKKKMDGSSVNVPFRASNLQIVELNLEDKKRIKKTEIKQEKQNKSEKKDSDENKKEIKLKENKIQEKKQ